MTWWTWFMTPPVFAYIDPGAGTLITQLVLGGVAGLLVLVKVFWVRMKAALAECLTRLSVRRP